MAQKSSNSRQGNPSWPRYRSKHRDLSHDQAHADAADQSFHPPLSHALVCVNEAEVVGDQQSLETLIHTIRAHKSFGYDSEFIGEHSYHPELCLIQVSTFDRLALIDPLQSIDLLPFWKILADPTVEKIVHAGQPDLEPVMRHLGIPPQNIFDTQIAAGFAGLEYPMGLGNLLQELTGSALIGSSRNLKFSRWNKRPLSPSQLRYAADDVRYLPLLRQLLVDRLASNGNDAFALEECRTMSDPSLYVFDPATQRLRMRGVDKLGRERTAVLRALVAWRDGAAREQNIPPRSLVRDEVLYAMAAIPIRNEADVKQISGLPRPVKHHYMAQMIEAVDAALRATTHSASVHDETLSRPPRMNPEVLREQVEVMWDRVVQRCAARSIDPKLAASKRELERIVRAKHRGLFVDSLLLRGWRREVIGAFEFAS